MHTLPYIGRRVPFRDRIMCGIVGIVPAVDLTYIDAMIEQIRYRGPDDNGEYIDQENSVGLGMCRLSIIDLITGHQPMANETGQIWVLCNGEIFNSPELRKQLIARGHTFITQNSDVEVLLHLYEDHGVEMLSELNGMYAFVIYDKIKRILFGVRDRMGIKPLYYSLKNGLFAFASELKALKILPWISNDIDFQSLYDYLSLQFVPSPSSIFRDIHKLPPGSRFLFDIEKKD